MSLFILFIMTMLNNHLTISSPVFKNGETIPKEYTCEGLSYNPPLLIEGIPAETKTLAIIMDDPDATSGTFVHWLVWNIPPVNLLQENSNAGICGKNGAGKNEYTGPCPPYGTHRYFFKLYALDTFLDLPVTTGKETLEQAMKNHILAKAELLGYFQK